MTQPDPTPNMSAAASFVRRLLECVSYHDLDSDWLQLDCCARQIVRVELKRITPFLCKRFCKWRELTDWVRLTHACRFAARDVT